MPVSKTTFIFLTALSVLTFCIAIGIFFAAKFDNPFIGYWFYFIGWPALLIGSICAGVAARKNNARAAWASCAANILGATLPFLFPLYMS